MSNKPDFVPVDLPAPEGVEVLVRDETVTYGYSNLFHLRLRVRICTPGAPVAHERVLEKMGVYEDRLAQAKQELLQGFREQVRPYLEHPEFSSRLSQHLRRQLEAVPRTTGYA